MFELFSFKVEFKDDVNLTESNDFEFLNFKSLKYSISDNTRDIFLDNSCDPDINFFDTDIQNIDIPYLLIITNHT